MRKKYNTIASVQSARHGNVSNVPKLPDRPLSGGSTDSSNAPSTTVENELHKLGNLLASIEAALENAAACVCRIVDLCSDGSGYSKISQRYPGIGPHMIERLERYGRGKILKDLFWNRSPGAERLSELPIQTQQQFSTNLIPVVKGQNEDGSPIIEQKPLSELTQREAFQVFDKEGFRSIEGQIEWRHRPVYIQPKFEFDLDKLEVLIGGLRFNATELEVIVHKLKEEAIRRLPDYVRERQGAMA